METDGKILVSACLLGQPVRYDGGHKRSSHPMLARWAAEGRLVALCPEQAGGLPTPRAAAEIQGGTAEDVLEGRARIVDTTGADVTAEFLAGAEAALALARAKGCTLAVLTERSPSCGSNLVYDGSFSGRVQPGSGVVTALLRRHGIQVLAPEQLGGA